MNISEEFHCPCGEWHETPRWLRWIGKPLYRRRLYAWPQIGGGWDGWEYTSSPVEDDPWERSLREEFQRRLERLRESRAALSSQDRV